MIRKTGKSPKKTRPFACDRLKEAINSLPFFPLKRWTLFLLLASGLVNPVTSLPNKIQKNIVPPLKAVFSRSSSFPSYMPSAYSTKHIL